MTIVSRRGVRAGETIESAVARLNAAGPRAGVRVYRLSAVELILEHEGTRAGVTLDEAGRRYFLTGAPETIDRGFGPGGPAFGMGDTSYGHVRPGTLIAGRAWSSSVFATREKATGAWELSPNDPLSTFSHRQLTAYGWHRVMSRRAVAMLLMVPALFAVVVTVVAVALSLMVAPWVGPGVVGAFVLSVLGLVLQGPRTPDQTLRKQLDTAVFWIGIAGPLGGFYLIDAAVERSQPLLGVLGALVVVAAAAAQLLRRWPRPNARGV